MDISEVPGVVSVGNNNIPGYCKILCLYSCILYISEDVDFRSSEDESENGNRNFLVKQDGRC